MKRLRAKQIISEDEQIARYAYVLGNVPAVIADRGYVAAFQRLATPQRERLMKWLREQLPLACKTSQHLTIQNRSRY